MNERSVAQLHRQMNMIYKSLGMPAIGEEPPSSVDIDAQNEELYERDDHRQFHVPVLQVRNHFYSIMAKSAADAEAIVQERMRRAYNEDEVSDRYQVGPAIEA